MKDPDKNIAYVGTLQEMGCPYSMLFVDKEERQLYIFIRLENDNDRFLMAGVSPDEVESYMNERMGLLSLIKGKPYHIATIDNSKISINRESLSGFMPTERMRMMNMFDPELCDDDAWLEIFLNRVTENKPLEIA